MHWLRTALSPAAAAVRAPATWLFAGAWVTAATILAARGFGYRAAYALGVLLLVLALSWTTVLLTGEPPPDSPRESKARLLLQTSAVLVIAGLVGLSAMSFYRVGPSAFRSIPIWSGLFDALIALGRGLRVDAPAAISNPVLELFLPLGVLLLLGAKLDELGFGRGHHSGRVLLLWGIPQALVLVVTLLAGQTSIPHLLALFVRNGFQNGPVEEFLFRGALQTRLSRLLGRDWGLALAALVFGAWHTGTNSAGTTHGDVLSGLCIGIVAQAPFGIAFGVILQRTRNLLAGSIFHMLIDLP